MPDVASMFIVFFKKFKFTLTNVTLSKVFFWRVDIEIKVCSNWSNRKTTSKVIVSYVEK